jgi:exo-beta-1,3-glucanase (GH17 family)
MSGYDVVRIYGTDCNQVSNAIQAGKAHGKKLFAGIFDLDQVTNEVNIIAQAVQANGGDWSIFDTINIGNEDVGNKRASIDAVKQAMSTATPILRNAGYNGSIVHVDTNAAFLNPANAALCDSSAAGDYIAANTHAFFNPNGDSSSAGDFIALQIKLLGACANKASKKRGEGRIRITETGWPKQGQANGKAVPSPENQKAAIAAIKKSVPGDVLFFSAFNAQWQDPGYLGVEPYWGILDN